MRVFSHMLNWCDNSDNTASHLSSDDPRRHTDTSPSIKGKAQGKEKGKKKEERNDDDEEVEVRTNKGSEETTQSGGDKTESTGLLYYDRAFPQWQLHPLLRAQVRIHTLCMHKFCAPHNVEFLS